MDPREHPRVMRALVFAASVLLSACQSGAALGAACQRAAECASPLVCRFGRCRSECAAQRDCPIGATCLLDADGNGSCALVDDPDCTTAGCEAPLACVSGACVNVCSVGVECPPGSSCVPIGDGRARCVRADGADAGLPTGDASACVGPSCDVPLEISVGDGFSCVRTMSRDVSCWGEGRAIGRDLDYTGCTMLGGDLYACPTPAPLVAEGAGGEVGPAADADRVDAQDTGGCFATYSTSRVACWGTSAAEASLGRDILTGERARLVLREDTRGPLEDVDRVLVFTGSAIAITHAGAWWGWGNGAGSVLGVVPSSPYAMPLASAFVDTIHVVTSPTHGCGIDTAGDVWCWGLNDVGQSDPTDTRGMPVGPTRVPEAHGASDLVLGRTHSCALVAGSLVCWGAREGLWLGTSTVCPMASTRCAPIALPIGSITIDRLVPARNTDDLCVIDPSDTLHCWGGSYAVRSTLPSPVPGLPPVGSAALTWTHACALTTNAEIWCWGLNDRGELGRLPLVPTGTQPAMRVVLP